jgi:hypothetical protein
VLAMMIWRVGVSIGRGEHSSVAHYFRSHQGHGP